MRSLVTVSNALVCAIVDGCGAPARELLAHAKLDEASVRDITQRTSIVRLAKLWRRVVATTGDDFIGLTIGARARSEQFGLGAHAAMHGDTFRRVLLQFTRYATLINDLLECRLEEDGDVARFVARLHWDVLGLERHAVDITFAGVAKFAREQLPRPLAIRELHVKHRLGGPYREVFGAPVTFGSNRYALVFDAAALDEPVARSSPEVGIVLDRYARQELDRIPVVTDLPSRVKQVVRAQLVAREPVGLATLASRLEIPARSLQRKLKDHATSVSVLVDDVRRQLAPEWLAAPDANVEQVGFSLGYSEPTAFIRAFKKWFGVTPGAFRRTKGERKADPGA